MKKIREINSLVASLVKTFDFTGKNVDFPQKIVIAFYSTFP